MVSFLNVKARIAMEKIQLRVDYHVDDELPNEVFDTPNLWD